MFEFLVWSLLCSFSLFAESTSNQIFQKTSSFQTTKPRCNNCDTALQAEHFFKVLLAEFHQAPPACTCVQLCTNLRPYCFPEGCSKQMSIDAPKAVNIWNNASEKRVRQAKPYVNDKKVYNTMGDSDALKFEFDIATQKGPLKQRSWMSEIRPNTYIDRYRKVVKYRKLPKIEVYYKQKENSNNNKKQKVFLKYSKNAVEMSQIPTNLQILGMKSTDPTNVINEIGKIAQIKNNNNNYDWAPKPSMTGLKQRAYGKIIVPKNKINSIALTVEKNAISNNNIHEKNNIKIKNDIRDQPTITNLKNNDDMKQSYTSKINNNKNAVQGTPNKSYKNDNYNDELTLGKLTQREAYKTNEVNKINTEIHENIVLKKVGFIEVPQLIAFDIARHYLV